MIKLVIVGGGGHAKVCASVADASGLYSVVGFLDRAGDHAAASPVIGDDSYLSDLYVSGMRHAFVAVGDNRRRLDMAEALLAQGWSLPTLTHPSAIIDRRSSIGSGTLVAAGVVVNVDSSIGIACIVNTGSSIDHDCAVDDGCHVAPGARLCGTVRLGRGAMVGVGAVVIPGISIGPWVVVGAGAAVIGDVAEGALVVGVPAHLVGKSTSMGEM